MSETFARGRQVGPGELAEIRAAAKSEAGTFVDLGSREAIRAAIAAGACPFCGTTKFKNLAGHTYRSHGHSAAEVREMAGMLKGEPLCSPDLSARQREIRRGRRLPDSAYANISGTRRTYSEAGRAVQRDKARRVSDSQRRAAAEASGAKQLTANAEKHRACVDLWNDGLNLKQIGAAVGMHSRTVKAALERAGIQIGDGRTARWHR